MISRGYLLDITGPKKEKWRADVLKKNKNSHHPLWM
jgi:hypothetical protein